ncbi:MAG: tryptophan synthase subunit alpha [Candidatus Diapherotrites archaeon]|uniref:Tryptophan synthase alpha chain n=1 Tax=Candidatus Iainarchaeum sp. TaxID=3101447 RepID=A0A938YTG6_9ARCH|nr:tryptophan synthase subunit alpha [Candidatus Diapherotrites archaeon]
MSRFEKRFKELKAKKEGAFIPFLVLGDPNAELSLEIAKTLVDSGADALELGPCFSDPIADGPSIQEADQRALASGMNTDKSLALIKRIRAYNKEIPISLLIYYNLIFQRGVDKFYSDAKKAGIDAVLAADCPVEEAKPLLKAARKHGIDQVFIVSPTTTKKRLKKILKHCSGYVYVVSLLGVTGARATLQNRAIHLIRRVRPYTKLPLCVGFGISRPKQVKQVINAGADGVIVGSAVINIIKENLHSEMKMLAALKKFSFSMKSATSAK